MGVLYLILLMLTAGLLTAAGVRVASMIQRASGVSLDPPVARITWLVLVACLVIVAAPSGVILGMILLGLVGLLTASALPPIVSHHLLPACAAVAAASTLPMALLEPMPHVIGVLLVAAVFFFLLRATPTFCGSYHCLTVVALATLLPLMLAPLVLVSLPSSLAVDGALVAAATLGVVLAHPADADNTQLRQPLMLLCASLIAYAALNGAWHVSALSLVVGGCAVVWTWAMPKGSAHAI